VPLAQKTPLAHSVVIATLTQLKIKNLVAALKNATANAKIRVAAIRNKIRKVKLVI
jgi:hypothetical protein